MKKNALHILLLLCLGLYSGCREEVKNEELPDETSLHLSRLNEDNRAVELLDYLELLAAYDGNPHIVINGTHIYLPPVGYGPMIDKDGKRFSRRYQKVEDGELLIEIDSEPKVDPINAVRDWIKLHSPKGVLLQFGDNVGFQTGLNIIDILSKAEVYYGLSRESEDENVIKLDILERIDTY